MQRGRVVVVTGAAGGMGTLIVDRFLANGDTVIATDTNKEALTRLCTARDVDKALVPVVGDVSKEIDCANLAEAARASTGQIDVLVHCAGWFPIRPFEEVTVAEWNQVIDINLTGAFLLTRAVLPYMKKSGWGRIVNFGSASIFEGVAVQTAYVTAKAGIIGFSRCIARELGQYGITVNVVSPGLTVSAPVLKNFSAAILAEQRNRRSIKRDEVPADLVGTTFFLASPDANFLTGQNIVVDGGKFMM